MNNVGVRVLVSLGLALASAQSSAAIDHHASSDDSPSMQGVNITNRSIGLSERLISVGTRLTLINAVASSSGPPPAVLRDRRKRDKDARQDDNSSSLNNDSNPASADNGINNGAIPTAAEAIPPKPTRPIGPPPADFRGQQLPAKGKNNDFTQGWSDGRDNTWGEPGEAATGANAEWGEADTETNSNNSSDRIRKHHQTLPTNTNSKSNDRAQGFNKAEQAKNAIEAAKQRKERREAIERQRERDEFFANRAKEAQARLEQEKQRQEYEAAKQQWPELARRAMDANERRMAAEASKRAPELAARSTKRENTLTQDSNASRVYNETIVKFFNGSQEPKVDYGGDIKVVKYDNGREIPELVPGLLGKRLGGGANSVVYKSRSRPGQVVNKLVALTDAKGNFRKSKERAITDQLVGRQILRDIKSAKPVSPFRIAQQYGEPDVWRKKDNNGKTHLFARTREEDISSPAYHRDGTPWVNADGQTITVSNAAERVAARGRPLTEREELTIALVIRDLNQNGIVWTDHKLANLDVVKDPNSPTGYQVIFFDFDAFRPVKGASRIDRYRTARATQKIFDTIPRDGFPTTPEGGNIGNRFDFTVFGEDVEFRYLFTRGANSHRTTYSKMNNLTSNQFNRVLVDTTKDFRLAIADDGL